MWKKAWWLGLGALVCASLTGCSTISDAEWNAMAKEQTPIWLDAYGGEVQSPEFRRYLSSVGNDVLPDGSRLAPTFHAMNDGLKVVYVSIPESSVLVTRGLLDVLDNEAQLAAVLAHEIAHLELRHVRNKIEGEIERERTENVRTSLLAGKSLLQSLEESEAIAFESFEGRKLLEIRYTQDQELDAAIRAMDLLQDAGYSLVEMDRLFVTFSELQTRGDVDFDGIGVYRNITLSVIDSVREELQQRDLEAGRTGAAEYQAAMQQLSAPSN